MSHRLTRRGIIGAIGGTAAAGLASGFGAAREGASPEAEDEDDYWLVTGETAETTVASDLDEGFRSDGDVIVDEGVSVDGEIAADGHVLLGDGATVTGPIEATGAVVTGSVVDLAGGVVAGDDVLLGVDIVRGWQAYEDDELETVGDLPIGEGVLVEGDVTSQGDVVVGPDGIVEGNVTADREQATEGDGAETETETETEERPPGVVLGTWVSVEGDLIAAGNAVLGSNSYVYGSVTAGDLALFGEDVTVDGIDAERIEQSEEADVFERADVDGRT